MLNLCFLSEMGIKPQFAGAKLHLIYQITKILGIFLLQNAHFIGFVASLSQFFSSSSRYGDNFSYTIS